MKVSFGDFISNKLDLFFELRIGVLRRQDRPRENRDVQLIGWQAMSDLPSIKHELLPFFFRRLPRKLDPIAALGLGQTLAVFERLLAEIVVAVDEQLPCW